MIAILIGAALLALAFCYASPREGLFVCVLVGFLADPLRKLTPGEPVLFVAAIIFFIGAAFVGVLAHGSRLRLPAVLGQGRGVRRPLRLFGALVAVQALLSFVRTGSLVIAGIGAIAYFSPVPAVFLGYSLTRSKADITRFLKFYVIPAALFVSGVFLSILGFNARVLDAVGEELRVYSDTTGQSVRLLSGFLRTSEIAAWHAGTAVCFIVILWVSARKKPEYHWLAGFATVLLIIAILLTGRRKALAAIGLFIVFYGFLLAHFKHGARKLATFVLISLAAAGVLIETKVVSDDRVSPYHVYFERGRTTTGFNSIERVKSMTINSFRWVLEGNGFFGAGAGTGSQGAQHFGGGAGIVGSSAEGGLGKILAELGVPGFVLMLWIVFVVLRAVWPFTRQLTRGDPETATVVMGLEAFLAANAIEFATAHQVFGDPFVLIMLGLSFGFVLAMGKPQVKAGVVRAEVGPAPAARPVRPLAAAVRPIEIDLS